MQFLFSLLKWGFPTPLLVSFWLHVYDGIKKHTNIMQLWHLGFDCLKYPYCQPDKKYRK